MAGCAACNTKWPESPRIVGAVKPQETTLGPGDLLYIPRGFAFFAEATSTERSLELRLSTGQVKYGILPANMKMAPVTSDCG